MCAKFIFSANVIYANVIGNNSFSTGDKPLVPGLKLLEYLNMQRYLKTTWSPKSIKERSPRKSMVPRRIGIVRYNQNSTSITKKKKT